MKKTLTVSIILITFLLGVFSLYGHDDPGGIWVSRSGPARDIDMSRDNSTLWIVSNERASGGSGYKVKQRVGMNWVTRSNGLSEGAFRITVDDYGSPWVITGNRTIKYWDFTQYKFLSIPSNKTAHDLTIKQDNSTGDHGLYICSTESANDGIGFKIYRYQGGNSWHLYSHNIGGHRIAVNSDGNPAIVRYTNQGSSYERGDIYLWDGLEFRIASPSGFKVHDIDNTCSPRSFLFLTIAATDDPGENDSHIFMMREDYVFDRDPGNFMEYSHAPAGSKYDSFTFDITQQSPGWCTITGNSTYEYLQKLNHHNIYGYGSSAYNSNYIGEKALDGNKYTKWNTSYWYGPPHSLVMDLGDIYSSGIEIGAVGILHAGWCEYDKYNTKNYEIQTSFDLVYWTPQVTVTGNTQDETLHIFPSLEDTKYIRLYITDPGEYYARIYEVYVYGYTDLDW